MPGTDIDETQRLIMGELGLFPHLGELPGRGAGADLIGRLTQVQIRIGGYRKNAA